MSPRDFFPLRVCGTRVELDGLAKTVMFEIPDRLMDTFAWRPGQHVSIRFTIDGEEHRRSYSVSSSPYSGGPLRITVKRVKGGSVSNFINDTVQEGQTIDVMPPFGSFCLEPDETARRTHYFLGAGSGITPLFAMLNSVLTAEPYSVAHLAYGNSNAQSILFQEELSVLKEAHPERLTINHVFSKPGWWSSAEYWRQGTIDLPAIEALITEYPPYAQDAQYYVCGPGDMNQTVKSALMSIDVPTNRIHVESYGASPDLDTGFEGVEATAELTLEGARHLISISKGQTLLHAAQSAGLKPPYSCQSGVCGACRAKLTNGTVHMRARMALEDEDIKAGEILTCQSIPTVEKLAISFDQTRR